MTDVPGKSTPISAPITDLTPLSYDESKWFMCGTGMCGWLAMTGRPDIKYAHSRISQHMAAPCCGALKALKHCIAYCKETQYFESTGASGRRRMVEMSARVSTAILITPGMRRFRMSADHSSGEWPCWAQC